MLSSPGDTTDLQGKVDEAGPIQGKVVTSMRVVP